MGINMAGGLPIGKTKNWSVMFSPRQTHWVTAFFAAYLASALYMLGQRRCEVKVADIFIVLLKQPALLPNCS